MTKFLTKAALAATIATGLFAAPAIAANKETAPFTAKAKIVKPLTLKNTGALDFGTITMGTTLTSSTVVVARTDGPGASCGTNLTCTGTQTAATFDVTGVALQALSIKVDTTVIALVHSVDTTKSVSFTANPDTSVTLSSTGTGSFDVGGSITVTSGTLDGDYSASIPVTVEYS
ncbi:MAG TPA: DUF4402 domain-containing protein [Sphingomicrobium sp.]|nr:DUF4402 domain-containing protein [Sphingomicrobium sp.]